MSAEPEIAMRPAGSGTEPGSACPWCGKRLVPGSERGTVRCASCGVRITWPVPTDEELELAYGAWYRPDHGRFSGLGDRLL
ncbi:MAG: hypothetical protein WBV53_15015, partial [Solirubrobacterales bacterium]